MAKQIETTLCFLRSEIPDWFSNQGSGFSIIIQLPRYCCDKNFIKFALCAVTEVEPGSDDDADETYETFVECSSYFIIKTLSETKYFQDFCPLSVDTSFDSDHVLLGFCPSWNVGLPDGDHHTTVIFNFHVGNTYANHKVKCCGVYPVYINPNETKPTTLTLKNCCRR